MYLDNIIGHNTSKSTDEVLLKGDFENTGKILNGRVKLASESGDVVWVDKEIIETLGAKDALAELEALENVQPTNYLTEPEPTAQPKEQEIYHIVKRGQTFQSIASYYGIDESTLRGANTTQSFCIGARLLIKRGI